MTIKRIQTFYVYSILCVFFELEAVFWRSPHAWATGIYLTRQNSDEAAQPVLRTACSTCGHYVIWLRRTGWGRAYVLGRQHFMKLHRVTRSTESRASQTGRQLKTHILCIIHGVKYTKQREDRQRSGQANENRQDDKINQDRDAEIRITHREQVSRANVLYLCEEDQKNKKSQGSRI